MLVRAGWSRETAGVEPADQTLDFAGRSTWRPWPRSIRRCLRSPSSLVASDMAEAMVADPVARDCAADRLTQVVFLRSSLRAEEHADASDVRTGQRCSGDVWCWLSSLCQRAVHRELQLRLTFRRRMHNRTDWQPLVRLSRSNLPERLPLLGP